MNTNISAVEVVLDQRSNEWHQFRAKRIGASDAPIICGHSPWSNSLQLWMEKTGKIVRKDNSDNFAIQRGIRVEPVARSMVSLFLERSFEPVTFSHPTLQYLMASLDGWDKEHLDSLEIKIGNIKDHQKLIGETESTPGRIIVPKKYYAQLQQQIYVTDREYEYFASYHLQKGQDDACGDLRVVKVWRDEAFLARYLPVAENFYHCLISNQPPEAVKLEI